MREFAFEIALCAHLETDLDRLIGRQLGVSVDGRSNRILDVVLVEPGPEFERRRAITADAIPEPAIASAVGPGRYRYWKEAFEPLDLHPETCNRIIERAEGVGFFERIRRRGREFVRQTTRYPDWIGRITAIENKPDLGRPGQLGRQLQIDVSLGVVDEVILATSSYVTGAHLNRLPDAVGVWRFRPGAGIDVVRDPKPLPTTADGIDVVDRQTGRADIRFVSPEKKRRIRRRIAERTYGRGWRPERFPGCTEVSPHAVADSPGLPYCEFKSRIVNPANCGPCCPGFDPAAPPQIDRATIRDERSPWASNPSGFARRQVELDRFVDDRGG